MRPCKRGQGGQSRRMRPGQASPGEPGEVKPVAASEAKAGQDDAGHNRRGGERRQEERASLGIPVQAREGRPEPCRPVKRGRGSFGQGRACHARLGTHAGLRQGGARRGHETPRRGKTCCRNSRARLRCAPCGMLRRKASCCASVSGGVLAGWRYDAGGGAQAAQRCACTRCTAPNRTPAAAPRAAVTTLPRPPRRSMRRPPLRRRRRRCSCPSVLPPRPPKLEQPLQQAPAAAPGSLGPKGASPPATPRRVPMPQCRPGGPCLTRDCARRLGAPAAGRAARQERVQSMLSQQTHGPAGVTHRVLCRRYEQMARALLNQPIAINTSGLDGPCPAFRVLRQPICAGRTMPSLPSTPSTHLAGRTMPSLPTFRVLRQPICAGRTMPSLPSTPSTHLGWTDHAQPSEYSVPHDFTQPALVGGQADNTRCPRLCRCSLETQPAPCRPCPTHQPPGLCAPMRPLSNQERPASALSSWWVAASKE
eukprot:365810-Chlamydomonas_euryale.AAC.26